MKKVIFLVSVTAFLFATMEVALKLAGSSLDPLQMTFLRFLIGGLMLMPFAADETKKSGYRFSRNDLAWLSLVGIMGIPVSMLCFQLAVMRCNAATAASLFCLNPLFTMVIAHIFTAEKMDRLKAVAFVIGLIAAFFMIRIWDMQEGNTPAGIILILTAAVTFSAYSVMGKRSIARIGTFTQTSASFIIGSLVMLPVMMLSGRPVLAGVAANWQIVAYCGIIVTGLGYMCYFLAIRASDATTGGVAFFIKPAIAPFLAVLVLGEEIYWNTIIGIALLLTASAITLHDAAGHEKEAQSSK